MRKPSEASRRRVLKTIGAGVAVGAVTTGSASAREENHYGRGNALDEFLNEEAEFKESPIWDGEIANRMGEEVVDVAVGALTSHTHPEIPVPEAPFAFAPHVVKVSPGATVRWRWVSNPYDVPIPHDVTSLVDEDGEVVLEPHGGARFHHHDRYRPATDGNGLEEDVNPTFEFTFEERGNHLYHCTPHGAPFEYHGHYNAFGMRGAVKVAGKPLED